MRFWYPVVCYVVLRAVVVIGWYVVGMDGAFLLTGGRCLYGLDPSLELVLTCRGFVSLCYPLS